MARRLFVMFFLWAIQLDEKKPYGATANGMSFNVYRPSSCQLMTIRWLVSGATVHSPPLSSYSLVRHVVFLFFSLLLLFFHHLFYNMRGVASQLGTKGIQKAKGVFFLCGIGGDASQPGGAWKRKNAHRPHVYHYRLSCYLFDLLSLFFVDLLEKKKKKESYFF